MKKIIFGLLLLGTINVVASTETFIQGPTDPEIKYTKELVSSEYGSGFEFLIGQPLRFSMESTAEGICKRLGYDDGHSKVKGGKRCGNQCSGRYYAHLTETVAVNKKGNPIKIEKSRFVKSIVCVNL